MEKYLINEEFVNVKSRVDEYLETYSRVKWSRTPRPLALLTAKLSIKRLIASADKPFVHTDRKHRQQASKTQHTKIIKHPLLPLFRPAYPVIMTRTSVKLTTHLRPNRRQTSRASSRTDGMKRTRIPEVRTPLS